MKKFYFLLLLSLLLSAETIAQITPHIVGGDDTDIDEVPWQVLLEIDGLDQCGGSIIAPNWILTAAHCLEGVTTSDIRVIAGITLRSQKNNGQIRNVVEIIRHPDYDTNPDSEFDHDIALLRLSSPLTLNNDVQVIDYATQADADAGWTDPGQIATVSGWGRLSFQGARPDHLQSVDIPIVDNATAAGQYNPFPQNLDITANMLAAGNVGTGGQDACQGDSGGPLIVQDNNDRNILAGVVSFGIDCADPDFMGIYTRVSRYDEWIAAHLATITGPGSFCDTATYTLDSRVPLSGATVTWEVSPGSLFQNAIGTGNSAFLESSTTSSIGEIDLTFTINDDWGETTVTRSIDAGTPFVSLSTYCYDFYSTVCNLSAAGMRSSFSYGEILILQLEGLGTSGNGFGADPDWEWERVYGGFEFVGGYYGHPRNNGQKSIGSVASLQMTMSGGAQFRARARNECGWGNWKYFVWNNISVTGNYNYSYAPNPASSQITIENTAFKESQQTLLNRTKQKGYITVYNFNGAVVKTEEYNLGQASFTLGVSDLKPGKYFMKIGAAGQEETHQIVIMR